MMQMQNKGLRQATLSVTVLTALTLGACAGPTAYQRPSVTVPNAWQQEAVKHDADVRAQQDLSPWWQRMGDPVLVQLIDEALARNNNLAQAAIKVQRAQRVAGQAASDQLPSVKVQGSSTASRPLDGGSTTRVSAATASVSWELDLWGRLSAARSAAEWEAQATEEDRRAVAQSLVATVAKQYWQVAYLNQRIEASQQSIDYARQTLKLVQAQYDAGGTSGLELAQAAQSLAAQQAAHTQWVQQRVEARNALAILLDAPPGATQKESPRLTEGALPAVSSDLPASLMTRRPDLRAAELRLQKAGAVVDATRRSYYPTLTLTGSAGGTSEALSKVLQDPVGTLGAGLVLPFVQWRDMDKAVAISQADQDVAIRGFRQSWYQALAEVENALSARVQYEVQGESLTRALDAARTAERLAEVRYRAGSVPLKTWLDAQETRRQAELNLAANRLNRLNALATLYLNLGGDTVVRD